MCQRICANLKIVQEVDEIVGVFLALYRTFGQGLNARLCHSGSHYDNAHTAHHVGGLYLEHSTTNGPVFERLELVGLAASSVLWPLRVGSK